MSDRQLIGIFAEPEAAVAAVRACREGGAIIDDVYTPFPVHGMDDAMGLRRSRLPFACFAFGLLGGLLMLGFQFWASAVNWPIDVGGRPWNSLPAFLPITFESVVLCAALGSVATFFLLARLFPGKRPVLPDLRVTDDRFAVVLHTRGGGLDAHALQDLLRSHGAIEILDREVEEICAIS